MKTILTILLSLLTIAGYGQSVNNPTTKQLFGNKKLFEAPLPAIWQKVEKIFIWEGEDYYEYQIKKAPLSENLTKDVNEPITCNYIFDVKGSKTPYFLIYLPQSSYAEAVMQTWGVPDSTLDVYRVMLLQEVVNESGKPNLKMAGEVEGLDLQHAKFMYRTGKMVKTFWEDVEGMKYYKITFNKDKTKVFLHSVSLLDVTNE